MTHHITYRVFLCVVALFLPVMACGQLSGFECTSPADCSAEQRCNNGWCTSRSPLQPPPDTPPPVRHKANCTDGQTRPCEAHLAALPAPCTAGTQRCNKGEWAECKGAIAPITERCCDQIDNDCNGQIDDGCDAKAPDSKGCKTPVDPKEGQRRPCYTGPAGTADKGICKAGTQTYQTGAWSQCAGQIIPGTEACNGKDDDCDGDIDEGCHTCQVTSKAQSFGIAPHLRSGLITTNANGSRIARGWKTDLPIQLWDGEQFRLLRKLSTKKQSSSYVQWMRFHPTQQETLLVYRIGKRHIDVWHVNDGRYLRAIPLPPGIPGLALLKMQPQGQYLGVLDKIGVLYMLDLKSEQWQQLPKEETITNFAFHGNEGQLFYQTTALRRWDLNAKQQLRQSWTAGDPLSMTHVPLLDALLLHYRNHELILLDVDSGKIIHKLKINDLAHYLPSAGNDGLLVLDEQGLLREYKWKTASLSKGIKVCVFPGNVIARSDGQRIDIACPNGRISRWHMITGQKELQTPALLDSHLDSIRRLLFQPGGQWLASASNDGTVRLWPLAQTNAEPLVFQHNAPVSVMSWSADGRYLLTSADLSNGRSTLRLWDISAQQELTLTNEHTHLLTSSRQSNNGKYVATSDRNGVVRLWQPARGLQPMKKLFEWSTPPGITVGLHFSQGATNLFVGAQDGHVHRWDTTSGKAATPFHAHNAPLLAMAFHHTGHRLVTSSTDRVLRFWSWPKGILLHQTSHKEHAYANIAIRPKSQQVATSRGGEIVVWDDSGAELKTWQAHDKRIHDIAWSLDGHMLATAGDDQIVQVWRCP